MVKPIPDNYPRVAPYLIVDGASAAIDFYIEVLGATERGRMGGPDGHVGHAELELGDSLVMLADPFPAMGATAPTSAAQSGVSVMVYVEDVDAVIERAAARGATVVRPAEDQFYGDRLGQFDDPFGHRWSVATHIEDVSEEEMAKRAQAMAEQGGT